MGGEKGEVIGSTTSLIAKELKLIKGRNSDVSKAKDMHWFILIN